MNGGPSNSQPALQPTFKGYVKTTKDALILFEACLSGMINHVPRRPHDRERSQLIDGGNIFIYEEQASGIKRWTDGVTWSPSRILNNFLVYRELEKPFPPGVKKRAMKKTSRSRPTSSGSRISNDPYARSPESISVSSVGGDSRPHTDAERELYGSLVDSYGFKDKGLVKKTMSVTVNKVTHHLVSYYSVDQVLNSELITPSQQFPSIQIRHELLKGQSFRSPLEESMEGGVHDGMDPYGAYQQAPRDQIPHHAYQQSPAPSHYYSMPPYTPSHHAPMPMSHHQTAYQNHQAAPAPQPQQQAPASLYQSMQSMPSMQMPYQQHSQHNLGHYTSAHQHPHSMRQPQPISQHHYLQQPQRLEQQWH